MSIDPVKMHSIMLQVAQQDQRRGAGQVEKDFASLLEASASPTDQASAAGEAAESLLALLRLQSLSGLLVDESGEQDTGLFPGIALFPRPVAGAEQANRSYRQLQPRLEDVTPPARDDIEQMIDRIAAQVSLAPELIRSVVAAESDFQPQAVSAAGAQGLMQLMPETASELGVEDSFDPHQNLLGGSRYLKQLLDKYDGDLDKALAAYNWGQGNVDRKGLEEMPEETRNYLAKVKGKLAAQV